MKTIDFNGSHSETIKYDNLPDGIYYLFETDENGVPYAMGETHTEKDRTYKCVVGDAPVILQIIKCSYRVVHRER